MKNIFLLDIKILIVVLICIALITIPIILYIVEFGISLPHNTEVWGQFSDFMNLFVGISNVIVTGTVAYFLYDIQKHDDTKKRMQDKQDEIQKQLDESISKNKEKVLALSGLIESSLKFGSKTSASLKSYQTELSSKIFDLPIYQAYTNVEMDILVNKIARDEYYHSYYYTLKKKDMYDMLSTYDALYKTYELFLEDMRRVRDEVYQFKLKNQEYFEKAKIHLRLVHRKLKKEDKINYEVFRVINESLNKIQDIINKDDSDLYAMREQVYNPLLKFLYDNKLLIHEDYVQLAESISMANQSLHPVIASIRYFSERVKENYEHFDEILSKAKESSNDIILYSDSQ